MKKKKFSVLVVDDTPANLQVMVGMLKEKKYRIAVAPDGGKALDMVEKVAPDLILLDVMMPGMDGFEVCKKLKDNPSTAPVPVIFLTARAEPEDVVKGFEVGAVDYITKPFNKAELLARVETHLSLRRAQSEVIRLEQKNAALAMAVTANHEVNQPLTVLKGNYEIFRKLLNPEHVTEKQEKVLGKMKTSIDRIETILQKFFKVDSIHFAEYIGDRKMVIFDDEEEE